MLRKFLPFLSGFAAIPQCAVLSQILDDRAHMVNNERFDWEAYHDQPWEQYRMEGFSPRETERAVYSDFDTLNDVPTPTIGDVIPTKTKGVHIMPRLPQYSFDCGSDCYTFLCK